MRGDSRHRRRRRRRHVAPLSLPMLFRVGRARAVDRNGGDEGGDDAPVPEDLSAVKRPAVLNTSLP